jgi:hypothetical protein
MRSSRRFEQYLCDEPERSKAFATADQACGPIFENNTRIDEAPDRVPAGDVGVVVPS